VALRARFAMLARDAHNAICGVDGLVTPTCPRTAVPVAGHADPTIAAAWTRKTLRFTRPGNLFGLCGVSLPIGHLADTRPVGLQLLARGGDDAALISIAAAIEMLLSRQTR
jgi:Asp-tRNA(Asn)/Glu-tRNA(Gln) amidotransferase A subunit family amidase